jgi:hypothetical protein
LLKQHRMNLLEEIQETSLMLRMYEQQRLQQQQQKQNLGESKTNQLGHIPQDISLNDHEHRKRKQLDTPSQVSPGSDKSLSPKPNMKSRDHHSSGTETKESVDNKSIKMENNSSPVGPTLSRDVSDQNSTKKLRN